MSPAKQHLSRVAALGCLVCEHCGYGVGTPAQIHHPRFDVGGAQRESDWLAVPLCPEHHQGPTGIHALGASRFWLRYGLSEVDLIAMVMERLHGTGGDLDLLL